MLTRKSRYFILVAVFICFRNDLHAFQCVDELYFLAFFHNPLPKKNYGNHMANLGPYMAHIWEWYGKVEWWYGADMGPYFGKL